MTDDREYRHMRLELDDIAILTAPDKQLFACYLENVAGRGDRWVYVSTTRTRFDGGIYCGEETLEAIQARFTDWWQRGLWRIGL